MSTPSHLHIFIDGDYVSSLKYESGRIDIDSLEKFPLNALAIRRNSSSKFDLFRKVEFNTTLDRFNRGWDCFDRDVSLDELPISTESKSILLII